MKKGLNSLKNSLYSKLALTYFAVITISFVFLAMILSVWFQSYYYNQRKDTLLAQRSILNGLYQSFVYGSSDPKTLTGQLVVLDNFINARIWIVDRYLTIAATSSTSDVPLGSQVSEEEINNVLRGNILAKEGVFHDQFNTPMLTVAYPLTINNQVVGAVIMNSPIVEMKNAVKKVYTFIWLSAAVTIAISTFIIYLLSQRILIKPLYLINDTARAISNGEFEKRVKLSSKDEIGELAESFNSMADSLQNLENLRRDFIANISHELRSPITSIRGYIQGILDGTIPENKQEQYLSVVLDESKRLSRLINDVLDLSRLESGEFSMKMEKFDINELIRLTIIRFENEIDKKKLNVDVILTGDSVYVIGDRDRIGQVISNLIDNAIKFTGEEGRIGIITRIEGKAVIVQVSDTGTGIPPNELKLIWDRFHMVDKSRSVKKGTGLGLSIVRQIINQHGEKIWVESKEGEGTTFSFTLKLDENI